MTPAEIRPFSVSEPALGSLSARASEVPRLDVLSVCAKRNPPSLSLSESAGGVEIGLTFVIILRQQVEKPAVADPVHCGIEH